MIRRSFTSYLMISAFSSIRTHFRRVRVPAPVKGFAPIAGRSPVVCKTADEAVRPIQSNQRVFLHEIVASPHPLMNALLNRADELDEVEFTGIFPTKSEPFHVDDPKIKKAFYLNDHFIGPHDRKAIGKKSPHVRFIPMFLNEVGQHLRSPDFPIDVALMQLSPPDRHGWCSLGPSVVCGRAGVDSAKLIIAEINEQMPRTHGNSFVHYSHLDYVFHTNRQLPQYPLSNLTDEQIAIGKNIAGLIPDGACLQAGIGGVPDAALQFLKNHKDLGIHTEMFAESVIDLIECGAITGARKKTHIGKVVSAFVMGSDRLYRFIDDNPMFFFDSAEYTNDPYVISQNPNMIGINSALQVDLTGQVNADSFGSRQFSGVGGQVDFTRGASLSEGGRAIIALPSTAAKGKISRIVPALDPGSSVTTSRWHGATIVTEFGYADLWGLSTRQRAAALINIAHPKFREQLTKQAAELYGTD